MKLETILAAAVNSMVRGHHAAHCFRAHVVGQGYINDGSPNFDRGDYLRQLERSAKSECDNMGFSAEYAEPGYEQPKKGILFANWNHLPRDLDKILEKLGYAVEWSDEWSTCSNCNKAFRLSADSYIWEPAYKELSDGTYCLKCAEKFAEDE